MNYPAILALSTLALLLSVPAQAEDPEHVVKLLRTGDCPNCDLRGSDLAGLNLRSADLQGADLTGANLNLVNFTKADLSDAQLTGASLVFTDFTDATLDRATFTNVLIQGGDQWGPAKSFSETLLPNGVEAYTIPPDRDSSNPDPDE